ncbi:hypothetical protein LTR10_006570 [Elasticomyces elasticus]|nr:hypothetical protein LTR10_006570 [Elasticomyces elasticus]KAK4973027.1 hypothetical protein LTR42_006321 [Elasticomyces elasticus]
MNFLERSAVLKLVGYNYLPAERIFERCSRIHTCVHCTQLTALKDKIEYCIKPFTRSRLKPPFSGLELAVMAGAAPYSRDVTVVSGLTDFYANTERPLTTVTFTTLGYRHPGEGHHVLVEPVKVSLHRTRTPKGIFDFLGLPAELRNVIYKRLFVFDTIGFSATENTGRVYLEAHCRVKEGEERPFVKPISDTVPLTKLLALLATSKKIHSEAVPYLYHDNALLLSIEDMGDVLGRLALSRAKHLTKISIDFSRISCVSRAGQHLDKLAALRKLATVEDLAKLEFKFDPKDDALLQTKGFEHLAIGIENRAAITSFEQIPFFVQLALVASLAKEVVFTNQGLCPGIEAWVTEAVAKNKPPKQQPGCE